MTAVGSPNAPDAAAAGSSPAVVVVDRDAAVHIPPLVLSYSPYASPESKAEFLRLQDDAAPASKAKTFAELRAAVYERFAPVLARLKTMYPVEVASVPMGGVRTDVYTPKGGVGPQNARRVLIELHGGGFDAVAGITAALESIPVASVGRIKVVAVDYRQGPEFKFPASSEDVAAVYRDLLKTYKPQNIGLYGCSSGGLLAAEAVAWIAKQNLPRPGAVGIFCGGAVAWWTGGDSTVLGYPMMGFPVTSTHPPEEYFAGVDVNDPVVQPIRSPAVLANFPPTLIITSTRDHLLSPAVYTHTQLVRQGVEAELYVWEGMVHGFFTLYPELPETREALDVIVKFFDKHLGES